MYRLGRNDPANGADVLGLCDKNPTCLARQRVGQYNPQSIRENREYGGLICRDKKGRIYAKVARPALTMV
jgi:hypothetical protein